jgi:hypothetical protein
MARGHERCGDTRLAPTSPSPCEGGPGKGDKIDSPHPPIDQDEPRARLTRLTRLRAASPRTEAKVSSGADFCYLGQPALVAFADL